MKEFVVNILRTKTVGHSAITFSGTLLTGILGLIFYILLARFLGPKDFGILSVSILFLTLLCDISNVGINTGIVRFVGKYFVSDRNKALMFMKLGFETKLILSLVLVVFVWILIPFVAGSVFQKVEFIMPLRLSLLGFVGIMMFSVVNASFDSLQRYFSSNSLSVGMNGLRLVIIILLFSAGLLTLNNTIIVYGLMPLAGAVLGLSLLPRFLKVKEEGSVAGVFFNYNKWVAVFTAIAAISSRLDSFISTRLLTLEEVGIYSVAVSLSSVVPQIVLALGVVVAPKLASFGDNKTAFNYLKKLQLFVGALCVAGILVGIPLIYIVIPTFYGDVYFQSIYPFIVLLFAQALFLFSVPVHTAVIYYFAYPKLFIYISLLNIMVVGLVGWVLISTYGMIGAALTVLVGNLVSFIIPAIWVLNKFLRK